MATRRRLGSRILFYLLMLVILIYTIFPFYWALRSAITPDERLFETPVRYIPADPTLKNFRQVLSNDLFLRAILNSTFVAASVTLISLLIGAFAAYALGRFRFRGRSITLYLVLSMTMFPQIAVLGALFTMVNQFGVYNTL